jgi:hypothetical protein
MPWFNLFLVDLDFFVRAGLKVRHVQREIEKEKAVDTKRAVDTKKAPISLVRVSLFECAVWGDARHVANFFGAGFSFTSARGSFQFAGSKKMQWSLSLQTVRGSLSAVTNRSTVYSRASKLQ